MPCKEIVADLIQALMCAGDLSLERSKDPDRFEFNGWGATHQCADWDTMYKLAADLRWSDLEPEEGANI